MPRRKSPDSGKYTEHSVAILHPHWFYSTNFRVEPQKTAAETGNLAVVALVSGFYWRRLSDATGIFHGMMMLAIKAQVLASCKRTGFLEALISADNAATALENGLLFRVAQKLDEVGEDDMLNSFMQQFPQLLDFGSDYEVGADDRYLSAQTRLKADDLEPLLYIYDLQPPLAPWMLADKTWEPTSRP